MSHFCNLGQRLDSNLPANVAETAGVQWSHRRSLRIDVVIPLGTLLQVLAMVNSGLQLATRRGVAASPESLDESF